MPHPPPTSTPIPYTTLFRSEGDRRRRKQNREPVPFRIPGARAGFHFDRLRAGSCDSLWNRPKWKPADRKSTRLNSSHVAISYAVFCLKKKNEHDMVLVGDRR